MQIIWSDKQKDVNLQQPIYVYQYHSNKYIISIDIVMNKGYRKNSDLDAMIIAIDSLSRTNMMCIFVYDFFRQMVIYRSAHLIFDCPDIRDRQYIDVPPYWSLATKESSEALSIIRDNYMTISKKVTTDDMKTHVSITDFSIMIHNKVYFVNQKYTPLVLNEDGTPKIGLFTFSKSNKRAIECFLLTRSRKRFRFSFEKKCFEKYTSHITLSKTERGVLVRAKTGMTNDEIAKDMCLSVHTVKTHKSRIFRKLKASTIAEAIIMKDNYQL